MAKPSINKIVPFDANYDKIITMTYMGDMPYSNRIIVYDAETMDVQITQLMMFLCGKTIQSLLHRITKSLQRPLQEICTF